ncbi:hypothetical protein B0T14DRAFT_571807 [Immersiella caudata]|uniref:Uncharacterized protein n=1 Tax=Immersiella caudata TaxID=314043 RepID=A0AA39TYN5_9PEZI|nr:hypothetical protein B0T14DRAFT_571807 [Immersiella caudata]
MKASATRSRVDNVSSTPKKRPIKFWTASEVADYRSDGDRWVLAPNGKGGFDVYDVSDILQDDFDSSTFVSENGRVVLPDRSQWMLSEPSELCGKLLARRSLLEVSGNDGKYGRPTWVHYGNFFYDVTDFPFDNNKEKTQFSQATLQHGGNLASVFSRNDTLNANLKNRLEPHRCAMAFFPQVQMSPRQPHRAFAEEHVKYNIFPERRM